MDVLLQIRQTVLNCEAVVEGIRLTGARRQCRRCLRRDRDRAQIGERVGQVAQALAEIDLGEIVEKLSEIALLPVPPSSALTPTDAMNSWASLTYRRYFSPTSTLSKPRAVGLFVSGRGTTSFQ